MGYAEHYFEQPGETEKGISDDVDHCSNMDKDAKRTAQLIKKNKTFYCNVTQKVTRPKECAFNCKKCKDCDHNCSGCSGCTICRTAYSILLKDKDKEKTKSSFVQDIKKIAQEEMLGKDENMEQQEAKAAGKENLDLTAFEGFNPSSANQSWRPAIPCISLCEKNLYVNTDAVRMFELRGCKHIALLYDRQNNTMLLDFTEDSPRHMRLTTTHRTSGDAKVSLIGFRNHFGLKVTGKFRAALHSEGKVIVDLDDKVGA